MIFFKFVLLDTPRLYGRILFVSPTSPRTSAERNFPFFLMRRGVRVKKNSAERLSGRLRFRHLRGMSYTERRSHVVQTWQNTKKGEYDVVKHLKYNNISIYFFANVKAQLAVFYQ